MLTALGATRANDSLKALAFDVVPMLPLGHAEFGHNVKEEILTCLAISRMGRLGVSASPGRF